MKASLCLTTTTALLLLVAVAPAVDSAGPASPPDDSPYEQTSEYSGRRRVTSVMLRQSCVPGITEAWLANPQGLDERREAILDAIWRRDREAFQQLATSPTTGKDGRAYLNFDEICRQFDRYRDEGFRTMRHHPIKPVKTEEKTSVWCRHQWMTLPTGGTSVPKRGNLNLIFNPTDFSLMYVRFVAFSNSGHINVLPYPSSLIDNDPVRDRTPVAEK